MAEELTILMSIPEIDGSATLVGNDPGPEGSHEGWIPIQSCSFGLSRDTSASDATEDEKESPQPKTHIDDITVKRHADATTAELLTWLANPDEDARKKEKLLIDYCNASGRYYMRYELEDVELVSSAIAFQHPDDLSETLVFSYGHITIRQRPIDVNGEVLVNRETKTDYHNIPVE